MKLTPYGEKLVLNAHTVQFYTNLSVEYIDQAFNSTDKNLGKIIQKTPFINQHLTPLLPTVVCFYFSMNHSEI